MLCSKATWPYRDSQFDGRKDAAGGFIVSVALDTTALRLRQVRGPRGAAVKSGGASCCSNKSTPRNLRKCEANNRSQSQSEKRRNALLFDTSRLLFLTAVPRRAACEAQTRGRCGGMFHRSTVARPRLPHPCSRCDAGFSPRVRVRDIELRSVVANRKKLTYWY